MPFSDHETADLDHPFLGKQSSESDETATDYPPRSAHTPRRLLYAAGLVILGLVAWVAVLNSRLSQYSFKDTVYSPASHLSQHNRNVLFTFGFGLERTKYQGTPTTERDALWEDLYSFGISQIPRSSAAKLVNKTVLIPDLLPEKRYIIQLDVFHQLHCLNMIRKRLYSTYTSEDPLLMKIEHLEHCYDSLRQSLMCSADITPIPWQWDERQHKSNVVGKVLHTCRNFEAVREWAMERQVAKFDQDVYVPDDLS
ncbi:hypothetical protein QBC43DRAFT_285050 [Cladorrhinum sp. PSN259]|nr:hypothetical protein QBC43DRAFT_285050 [Cladorrhinum sp. PSN259]